MIDERCIQILFPNDSFLLGCVSFVFLVVGLYFYYKRKQAEKQIEELIKRAKRLQKRADEDTRYNVRS